MRKSSEEAAQTRRRIVQAGSRELGRRGIVSTGLNDLMKAAGLTHGGATIKDAKLVRIEVGESGWPLLEGV
jgi:hypothetical protein